MSASSLPLPQGKSVSLKQFVSRHINEIGLLVVIAILYLVFSLNAPGFISLNNQMNVLRDAATIGIAAWAMTLIIISGEIDVSVGPMVAFVSVCLAFLLQFDVPLAIACLLVLLLGALMGTLAGVHNDAASASSKNKKAKELGVPIITEDEFLELIEKNRIDS